jgi:hypothetical protein
MFLYKSIFPFIRSEFRVNAGANPQAGRLGLKLFVPTLRAQKLEFFQ